jgi:hypothetical protein
MSIAVAKSNVAIGNAAGWALAFARDAKDKGGFQISSTDYYAEIEAELPGDLHGGAYKFTIEGLIDEHYTRLVQLKGEESLGVVRLYLFWLDANASVAGYLENALGLTGLLGGLDQSALDKTLVATLAITKLARRVGPRRYDTIVEARELVYHQLSRAMSAPLVEQSFQDAVDKIAKDSGADITTHLKLPAASGQNPGTEQVSLPKGGSYAAALEHIATSVEQASGQGGRGLSLVRDGTLHFGLREIPLEGAGEKPKPLTLRTGLLQTELNGVVSADPNHDPATGPAPTRPEFKLTLKGRPDLKPGDLVGFAAPPEDVSVTLSGIAEAVAGSLAGDLVQELDAETLDTTLYVTSVQHRLGRTSGFSTVLTGVGVKDGQDAWDTPTKSGAAAAKNAGGGTVGARASGAGQARQAIRRVARDAALAEEPIEVAEVRATHTKGVKEPPSQTVTLISGLEPPDGRPNAARRLDLDRTTPPREVKGVPYVTPFAWGHAGLVLPRYPGTRVVLAHRHGDPNDPIDIGAVWGSGKGPDSNPGDWWLILPADPSNVKTAAMSGAAAATEPNDFNATNDLIDASGDRVIEVGRLSVRVGAKKLGKAGTRPAAPASSEYISIEHDDGKTKIVIDQNGNITLHTEKDMTLSAAQKITLDAPTVEVKANAMDVKKP